jgi:hypothetical protein
MDATKEQVKHTLGPWTLTDLGCSKRGNSLDATLNGSNGLPLMFIPFTSENQKANAHLIAAAPELLEAAQSIELLLFNLKNMYPGNKIVQFICNGGAVVTLSKAIAKAEGR